MTMNPLFLNDLVERLGNDLNIIKTDQKSLKDLICRLDMEDKFPMICHEYTEDSNFDVSINDSMFLNGMLHIGNWIAGMNDDEIVFICNLNAYGKRLDIDTLEVNKDYRGEGLGGNIVAVIESVAEHYYNEISASPFDVEAGNFWNHLDYLEWRDGILVKPLNMEI